MLGRIEMKLGNQDSLSYQMSSLFHGVLMERVSREYTFPIVSRTMEERTYYDLKSTWFHLEGVRIPAFIRKITIKISKTQTMANFAGLLFQFGTYSGVGIKAALGMGAVRLTEKREEPEDFDKKIPLKSIFNILNGNQGCSHYAGQVLDPEKKACYDGFYKRFGRGTKNSSVNCMTWGWEEFRWRKTDEIQGRRFIGSDY